MAYFDYSLRSDGILEKTKSETRRGIEPHEPVCAMFMAYKCRVRSAGGQPSLNGHSTLINPHDFHASTTGTVHIKGDTPCYALPGIHLVGAVQLLLIVEYNLKGRLQHACPP